MARKRSSKTSPESAIEGAAQFQEAIEVATSRRQESEKECRVHYRALVEQCSVLPADDQKQCVQEAAEAYRDMLAACRMRFEADMRAARVVLDIHLGTEEGAKKKAKR